MLNVLLGLSVAGAAPEASMAPGLEPLGFLVGHCWRGQVDGRDEVDVHCFEIRLGRQACSRPPRGEGRRHRL